jgi:hypothetical protein
MTTKKKVPGRPFQKGQSGNPLGGQLHNPEMRAIKRLSEKELIEVATFVLNSKVSQIKARMKHPDTSVLQGMVLGLALKCMTRGDASAFNALMDRLLGKVKDNLSLSGSIGGTSRVVITLPSNKREPNK